LLFNIAKAHRHKVIRVIRRLIREMSSRTEAEGPGGSGSGYQGFRIKDPVGAGWQPAQGTQEQRRDEF